MSKINFLLATLIVPFFCRGIEFTYKLEYKGSSKEVTIGDGKYAAIPKDTKGHLTIPSTINGYPVTKIADCAFTECTNITSATIPDSVKEIGGTAFCKCYELTSIPNIPKNISTISHDMFAYCTNLTSVVIPTHVTEVQMGTFDFCTGLKSVTIHKDVTNISWAFSGCTNVEEISIFAGRNGGDFDLFGNYGAGISTVDWNGYDVKTIHIDDLVAWCHMDERSHCAFKNAKLYVKGELASKNLVIPVGTKRIGDYAFISMPWIESVVIPEGVTNICKWAFSGCTNLTSVVLPDSLKGIWKSAFEDCTKLTSIELPDSLEYIGERAFLHCDKLKKIIIPPSVTYIYNRDNQSPFDYGVCVYLSTNYNGPSLGTRVHVVRYVPEQNVKFSVPYGTDCPNDIVVRFNKPYGALPTIARDGYEFGGWMMDGNMVYSTNVVTALDNHTLEASWSPNKYTILFDGNGGAGEMDSIVVAYDTMTNLASNIFYRQGKVFGGWATNSIDQTVIYENGAIVSNLTADANSTVTLYAVWYPLVVPKPTMVPSSESIFGTDSCFVTLSCELENAVIYYSTNGVTPRPVDNCKYTGPFEVYGDVNIKAVARFDGVNSEYLTGILRKGPPEKPVVSPGHGSTFAGTSCEVSITCATEGAAIYYSIDGRNPEQSDEFKYTGPFSISETTTIKVFSANNSKCSEIVTATISKFALTLADGAGALNLIFRTGEEAKWEPIEDKTASTGYSAQSGKIGCDAETWMETTIEGAGTLSFSWKVDCEYDDSGDCTWDRLVCFTNGVEACRIDGGVAGWQNVTYNFADSESRIVRWVFIKDGYDEPNAPYSDLAWVSGVSWASKQQNILVDVGNGKIISVPKAWIDKNTLRPIDALAANGRKVWECYVLGLSPENPIDDFKITSFKIVNGKPVFTYSHDTDGDGKSYASRIKVVGKKELTDVDWEDVTSENEDNCKFFKAEVCLP